MCQICPRSCDWESESEGGVNALEKTMKHCTPSVVCICSNYPSPPFPFFVNATFQGLLFLGTTVNHNSSAVLETVQLFWDPEPPLLVLPAARKCGRREMETEGAGAVSTESGEREG